MPKTESPSARSPHPPLQPGAAFAAGGSSAVTHPPWLPLKNQVVQIPGRALRLLRCDRPYCIVIHGSFLRVYISSGPGLFCRHTDYYMRDNHGYVPNFLYTDGKVFEMWRHRGLEIKTSGLIRGMMEGCAEIRPVLRQGGGDDGHGTGPQNPYFAGTQFF